MDALLKVLSIQVFIFQAGCGVGSSQNKGVSAMKYVGIFMLAGLCAVIASAQKYSCLPSNVKEDSVVSASAGRSKVNGGYNQVTVRQTLNKLNARCSHGKLIDKARKPIHFFWLVGCWGTPPEDYFEILDHEQKEIARLKRKYRVIEMTCNPGGIPPA